MKLVNLVILTFSLYATAPSATAQLWYPEVDLRDPGEIVWTTSMEGDLDRSDPARQVESITLPPAYTGPGYRFEVDYEMTRTRADYPDWEAVPRVDAPAADGQVWGRAKKEFFKGTITGSYTFCGEAHPSVRPHRLRFTFNQPASFPYHFKATVRARRNATINPGGITREEPEWLRVGTLDNPSWMSGDMYMKVTNHRWLLVSIEPGAQLRAKCRAGLVPVGNGAGIYCSFFNLDHDFVNQSILILSDTQTQDVLLRTNTTNQRQWFILGLRAGGTVRSFELGFYSPQSASPPVNTTVALPDLNPYRLAASATLDRTGPAGSVYEMALPGTGEMLRLTVRIQKTAWMGSGTGAGVRSTIYAQDGTVLKDYLVASDAFGLENAESFIEIDRSNDPAKRPVRAVFSTCYADNALNVTAIRYARVR